MSILVISDTHFGLSSSTLSDPDQVDYLMWEIWKYGGGCEEVVLLGDILDFWRSPPDKAIRDARYFFEMLSLLDVKISYVIGNHDHHLTVMHQEGRFLEKVAEGELGPVYVPNLSWTQSINGVEIDMHYPTYSMKRQNCRYLFAHGHHLDGIQAFSVQVVEKLRRLAGEKVSPSDLEMLMSYTYESIYRSSFIEEIVEIEERIWKASSIFDKVRRGIEKTFKFTPVELQYDAINSFIEERAEGRVDCFVYGDTHRADAYRRNCGPLAVNVGCFTGESCNGLIPNPGVIPNTYMLLDEGMTLRKLGREDPLLNEPVA